jgi:hypothetical protein
LNKEDEDEVAAALDQARQASQIARVALIVAGMAAALAILGLFLPIRIG